ncbi:hypothetical protein BBJ28_00004722 [Nothophytophthora sp. Chile5]|nr:hypothetical protein BBJ28_00004722 [Nothophytophthora sp. Chile5]
MAATQSQSKMPPTSGKRKRGAAFSAHEKLAHKSCVLLQRESKKVRAFLVRKAVQQLKQLRTQQEEPTTTSAAAETEQDEAKRKQKCETRALKLRNSVARIEREHAALKALDLQAVVARARLQTGLDRPVTATDEFELDHEEGEGSDDDVNDISSEQSDDEAGAEELMERGDAVPPMEPDQEAEEQAGEEVEGVQHVEDAEPLAGQQESSVGVDTPRLDSKPQQSDEKLAELLMDRILAHKQIVPLLDAIRTLVAKEEREAEKKRRANEKRALKRGHHDVLVGGTGRSAAPPNSLFLGSLSGRGGLDDDDLDMDSGGYGGGMNGADDDIAEFLGEKKKRKNRPGQMARRQKAIRQEESVKRKEDRSKGIYRPFKDAASSISKYGPSERPKKAKPKPKSAGKPRSDKQHARSDANAPAPSRQQRPAAPKAAAPVEAAHPSWLAKQKLKEKEQQGMHAFSGKKITFGDDD